MDLPPLERMYVLWPWRWRLPPPRDLPPLGSDVEPLGLYFTVESWVMVAHCRLRKEEREFRVDRIQEVREKEEHFALRPFALQRYFQKKQESHL